MAFKREKVLASAQKYAAKGQHDKSARDYQAIVDNDPTDLRAWLMLAGALQKADKADEALPKYLQVAKAYHEQKDYSKALAVYRQGLSIDPRRIDVHLKCAQLHSELRQIPEAVDIYEKVGKAYLKQGRSHDALELFKTVADLDPTTVTRRLRLAELYSREKMNDEAVAAFRAAGQLLLDEGKNDEYVRVAERLLYHRKDDRETVLGVVRAYIQLRQPRRALVKLNGLLQGDPADVQGLELLCETFVRLGKVDKAVSVTLEIVREHAQGPEGEDLARRVLERGLEWAPNNPELQKAFAAMGHDGESGAISIDEGGGDQVGELELDADEVVELDDDDVVEELTDFEELEEYDDFADFEDGEDDFAVEEEEEDEFADAALDTSLAREVMSDVGRQDGGSETGDLDLDRQLQESRVLAKYRLYDNALVHLDAVLEVQPTHLGALEAKLDVFEQAERTEGRVETLVTMGRVLAVSDPARASACAREALELEPKHPEATSLLSELGPETVIARAPTAPEEVEAPVAGDLLGDDESEFEELDLDTPLDDDDDYLELPMGEESQDFAIDVDEGEEEEELGDGPLTIEDRFGLPEESAELPVGGLAESAELPIGGIDDISEEVENIEGMLAMGREDEARRAFLDLASEHAGHPALSSLTERFDDAAQVERPPDSMAAEPLFNFEEDDEADDYLAGIFSDDDEEESSAAPAADKPAKRGRARAQVEGGEADAATHYDLGTAYRGMGLKDDALRELELAAADPAWTCRACILMATVHQQIAGDAAAASEAVARAVAAAVNADEISESNYLHGELLLELGDTQAARAAFEAVTPGFRERDAKLSVL